jgi:hypothetical protein
MRRQLAAVLLVALGLSTAAYAADPAKRFELSELRSDAHKARPPSPTPRASRSPGSPTSPCVDGRPPAPSRAPASTC